MTRPLAPIAAAAVAAAALLAGCGGKSGPTHFIVSLTRVCLRDHHLRVIRPPAEDFVASTATGGAIRAVLPDNAVTIAFGATLHDAVNIGQAYVNFAAKNVGVSDVLRQEENAVMLWQDHPSDSDAKLVESCLK